MKVADRILIVVVSLQDILENIYRILAGLHWNQSLSPSYYCTPVPVRSGTRLSIKKADRPY